MKKHSILSQLSAASLLLLMCQSCTKEFNLDDINWSYTSTGIPVTVTNTGKIISWPYTEEFKNMDSLFWSGLWYATDNTYDFSGKPVVTAHWMSPTVGFMDSSYYGFSAYSYDNGVGEFAYSAVPAYLDSFSFSSWLISPILRVKSGDKISFYTRGDTTDNFTDRMQVRMDGSTSTDIDKNLDSVGSFTTLLFDINPTQAPGGYPTVWTKYEYTFTGFAGIMDTRIAFRHYLVNPKKARGVGIDQFKFEVN
jgi:hypothetical protein